MYRYVESKSLCDTEFQEHALVLKWPATNLSNWRSKKKTTNEDEVQTTQEKQKEKPGSVFCNLSKTLFSSPWKERLTFGNKEPCFFFLFLPNKRQFFSPFSFSVKTCLGDASKKKKGKPNPFLFVFLVAQYHNNKKKNLGRPTTSSFFYSTCILKGATGIGTIW